MRAVKQATAISPVSNDAKEQIEFQVPYTARVTIAGVSPILWHRWSVESVEAKGKAAKGSRAKKEDDIESYVWRDEKGFLSLPTEYLRQSVIGAAKYRQDPRSPRKSAQDLFKAGVACGTDLCSLGTKDWDYIDRRRVNIQRAGITRSRPALLAGWRATRELAVLIPEYITPAVLNEVIQQAGRLVGVADNRPSFGRFQVTNFETW